MLLGAKGAEKKRCKEDGGEGKTGRTLILRAVFLDLFTYVMGRVFGLHPSFYEIYSNARVPFTGYQFSLEQSWLKVSF